MQAVGTLAPTNPARLPEAELAAEINEAHRAAENAIRRGLHYARQAGTLLLEAKARRDHGEWTPWLEANFQGSTRTAQAYMRVASRWAELEAKAQAVADLSFSGGLRLLTAPRTEDRPEPQEPTSPLSATEQARERFEAHAPVLSSDSWIIARDGFLELWIWPSVADGYFFTATFLPVGNPEEEGDCILTTTKRPVRADHVPSVLLRHGPGRAFQVETAEWEAVPTDKRLDYNWLLYGSREDWFQQEMLGKGAA